MFSGIKKGCIGKEWVNRCCANVPFVYPEEASRRFSDVFRSIAVHYWPGMG